MNRSLHAFAWVAAVLISQLGLAQASRGAPQMLPIDVTSTTVQGSFLLDGSPYPTSDFGTGNYETALFGLGSEGGGPIPLGDNEDMAYGPLSILPGGYTPIFEGIQSSRGQAPLSGPTALAGPVFITSHTVLDIDVPAIDVTFEFTLNGGYFPPAGTVVFGDKANFYLQHATTGHEILLGSSQDGVLTARILPGTYDVVYRHSPGEITGVPLNENAVVADDLVLSTSQTVFVDVPAVEVIIFFLLNGDPFPTYPAGDGRLELRNFETGDTVSYGLTSAGLASRILIKGTYDATWTRIGSSYLVPRNTTAVVEEGLDIQTAEPRVVDVQAATITLQPLLDGAAFPISDDDWGAIWLVDPHGAEVLLGRTDSLPSSGIFIVEGTYDAWYRAGQSQSTGIAPINPNARIATGLSLIGDQALQLDVPTATVALTYTLDGDPFPIDDQDPLIYQRCRFTLVGEGESNSIDLGENVDPPLDWLRLVAGSYDVEYDWLTGDKLPANTHHRVIENAALSEPAVLPVAVLSEAVTPVFYLDGVLFPTDSPDHGSEHGHFYLSQPSGGEVSLGASDQVTPTTVLAIEGAYDIEYEWSKGTTVPRNPRQHVGTAIVPEPGTTLSLTIGGLLLWAAYWHRRGGGSTD